MMPAYRIFPVPPLIWGFREGGRPRPLKWLHSTCVQIFSGIYDTDHLNVLVCKAMHSLIHSTEGVTRPGMLCCLNNLHMLSLSSRVIHVHHRMLNESMNERQLFQLSMLCPDDYIFGRVQRNYASRATGKHLWKAMWDISFILQKMYFTQLCSFSLLNFYKNEPNKIYKEKKISHSESIKGLGNPAHTHLLNGN